MELSTSVELRAPVIPADKKGEYMVLPPGGDTPVKAGRGGYFRAATDGAPVVWLGRIDWGDTPGAGVLGERAFGDTATHHWLSEFRAMPEHGWDPEQALLMARPVVQQLFGWVNRFSPNSQIANGKIVHSTPLPTPVYARPRSSTNMGGQTSGWLPNADGSDQIRGIKTHRLYLRRDALIRYLTSVPWPEGAWQRVHHSVGQKALENGEADWHGLVEAQPPTGLGLLHGADKRGRPRRLWSAAEILAWGLDGWNIHGAWVPEGTAPAPMRVLPSACAPLCSLVMFSLFHELVTGNYHQQHTLTMSWFTSRTRAPLAPATKAIHAWLSNEGAGLGHIYGQHIGAAYVTIPDEMFPDVFDAGKQSLPADQQWLAAPGSAWQRAEDANSDAAHLGEEAREQISLALDNGVIPDEAWLDLLCFGSTEQILRADRMNRERRLPPAFAAPETNMPVENADSERTTVFAGDSDLSAADARADLRMTPDSEMLGGVPSGGPADPSATKDNSRAGQVP